MFEPIPNFTVLRRNKDGYDTRISIDTEHPLHNDPLVDPREPEFGFTDASSYYSKPNRMTGETLPGVPDAPLLRLDVVKRLVRAERFLREDRDVRDALGAPAHLRIDDALRPYQVQKFAFEVAWPMVVKSVNPHLTDEEIELEVVRYCAKPKDAVTSTPHLTGGAVDLALANLDTGEAFNRGHQGGKVKGTAFPEFHEGYHLLGGSNSDIDDSAEQTPVEPIDGIVVMARRVLFYAMTKIAELEPNPNEIWHYGKGDPMSAYVSGSNRAYYGIAELPDWYKAEMSNFNTEVS